MTSFLKEAWAPRCPTRLGFRLASLVGLCLSLMTSHLFMTEAADPANSENTIEHWRQAAEREESWACYNLGLAYQMGKDVEKSEAECVKWYRIAADKGYAPAQANLGYCYEVGFGLPVNFVEAVRWYQMAALQGNALAQYNLGRKYMAGSPGVPVDPKTAERWLRLSAQQNFVPAFFSIGQLFASGLGANVDYEEAHSWFLQAAQQGYAPAQHAIGYLYAKGLGVPASYVEAVKWYNLAASRNYADSHYNLAICYERGLGVPQNLTAAVNHYRTAAEFGHPFAQYSLGVAYYEGKGVEADFVQAYKWWNLASVQGIPEAASSKDILTRLMDDEQIRKGQLEAAAFVPRKQGAAEAPRLNQLPGAEVSELKRIGTGFLVTTDGYIATTFSNVRGSTNLHVITEGGTFTAQVHKADPLKDIALIKINGSFSPLPLIQASSEADLGAKFLTVGFDSLTQVQFNPKAARGTITSVLGFKADPRQFTVDPALSSAFSGAALLNSRSQVIGMMLSRQGNTSDPQDSVTSGTAGFAIKSDHLVTFLATLPEVNSAIETASADSALPSEEVLSRARAATALIISL